MTSRKGLLRFSVSILVSAVLVYWLLRDVGVGGVVATLRGAYLPGLALGSVAFLLMVVTRVVRYRLLLARPVAVGPLTLITLVRGMLGDLLPARLGTLSYVWLVHRAGVPLDDAMSSFLLALVLDMVAIAPLLLVALVAVGGGAGVGALLLLSAVLLVGASAALLLLAPVLRWAGSRLAAFGAADRAGSRGAAGEGDGDRGAGASLRERLGQGLADTADRVVDARTRGVLLPAFGVSLLVRLSKFGAHWLFLQAVLVPLGVPWGSMGFFTGFLGIAGAELSGMLPISGIAAFGTWEAAWTLGFTRLGLSTEQAITSGFATHIVSQLHDYTLGIGALLLLMSPGLAALGRGTRARRDERV